MLSMRYILFDMIYYFFFFFFFFNDTATTEIYTLSLHDALPISRRKNCSRSQSSDRNRSRPRRPCHEPAGDRRSGPLQRRESPHARGACPDDAAGAGRDPGAPPCPVEGVHETGKCDRGRADRDEVDDANPFGLLGTGPGLRPAGDRPGPPEDGGPDRLPPAAPAERPVRHDRLEGVRAHEGP